MIELPSTTGMDVRTCVVRAMIESIVIRDIFCPVSGRVLDLRTCVALVGYPEADDVVMVVDPEAWREREASVRAMDAFTARNLTVWVGRVEQVNA